MFGFWIMCRRFRRSRRRTRGSVRWFSRSCWCECAICRSIRPTGRRRIWNHVRWRSRKHKIRQRIRLRWRRWRILWARRRWSHAPTSGRIKWQIWRWRRRRLQRKWRQRRKRNPVYILLRRSINAKRCSAGGVRYPCERRWRVPGCNANHGNIRRNPVD